MASEASRKKAEEIIGRCDIFMLTSHVAARGVAIDIIAAALDEARAEGAERERWECHRIASDFSDRIGGSAGAVAIRLADRGAMRGPEEE